MATTNLTSFAGQVILVTGAASGIGKAAAELIAERGGHVVCLDLNEAGLKTTVSEISAAGGKASYKTLDVSSQSGVKKVVAEILAEHGQIHALANSAGISGPTGKPVEEVIIKLEESLVKFKTRHSSAIVISNIQKKIDELKNTIQKN